MAKRTRGNKHKKSLKQLLMPIAKALPFFIALIFIVVRILESNPTEFLDVNITWEIDENLPIAQKALLNKIDPLIKDKYQLDLHQIKTSLEQEPWVAKAHIERLLWNSIRITIEQQQVAMRWKNKQGCQPNQSDTPCSGYISENGELFIPKNPIESDAVLAISSKDKQAISKLYQDYKHYQSLIEPMKIKEISRTNIDQLTIEPSVKVILGYQIQDERLINFKKIYKKLKKENSKVKRATFDMRYPKGFTLSY